MAGKIVDEGIFLVDEINGIIKDSIDETVMSAQFSHDKVIHWTNGIAEVCMKRLVGLAKPFKYIGLTSLSLLSYTSLPALEQPKRADFSVVRVDLSIKTATGHTIRGVFISKVFGSERAWTLVGCLLGLQE